MLVLYKSLKKIPFALSFIILFIFDISLFANNLPEKNILEKVSLKEEKNGKFENLDLNKIDILLKEANNEENAGNNTRAIKIYLVILNYFELNYEIEGSFFSNFLSRLAGLYFDEELYDESEKIFIRSLKIREKDIENNELDTAQDLSYLARINFIKNKITIAEDQFLKSFAIRERILGLNNSVTSDSILYLGRIYHSRGLYRKAEKYYLQALKIKEKILNSSHIEIAEINHDIGDLYRNEGLYDKSEYYYLKAISIYEKNEKFNNEENYYVTFLYGKTIGYLGTLYAQKGNYKKAEPLMLKALKIKKKYLGSEYNLTIQGQINDLGLVYLSQGLYEKAKPLLERSLKIIEELKDKDDITISRKLGNLAQLYEDQGLYKKAAYNLERALRIEFNYIKKIAPYLPLSERKSFLEMIGRNYESSFPFAFYEKSVSELALFTRLNRQGLLEEIEKRQSVLFSLSGENLKLVNEIKELNLKLASTSIKKTQRKILKSKKADLEKELYLLLPELRKDIVEISQVAGSIPKNSVLIEFQRYQKYDSKKPILEGWTEAYYLALLLKPNGNYVAIDLGLANPIDDLIREALISSEQGLEDASDLWKDISLLIIKPLESEIKNVEKLFISPDGELNRIPFAALSYKNKLLIDEKKIRLLTTGRELLALSKNSTPTKKKTLVIADPSFDLVKSKNDSNTSKKLQQRSADLKSFIWNSLPGTSREGKVISKITKGKLLTKNHATALAVQKSNSPKILHIASHSYFLSDQLKDENPLLRSGIVLAGANNPDSNKYDDGYLTALEVSKLDLIGTDLVVISGCESGLGEIKSGEGVYGLKRAITLAGSRSSLLSLWKVNDYGTAAFMESYYLKLKNGEGRAEALANTQKEFRKHPIEAWRHPNVWAAFQLSGDWRPIDF